MITRWLITGDTHGEFSRFRNYNEEIQKDSHTAVIILGDAGLNYTLDENDNHVKNFLMKKYNFYIYCVRGNHEARPQDVDGMEIIWDENVDGHVFYQPKWPHIRYFFDYGIYTINNYKVAIIGGAYSVDKFYRLARGQRWFNNEQLDFIERTNCSNLLNKKTIDFVFSHTCPYDWRPTDLFLNGIDQSKVDNTMELWMDQLKNEFNWSIWLFGHYHADRLERPYVEQFFKDTENLDDIWKRWDNYSLTNELDWWLVKSPNFYMK